MIREEYDAHLAAHYQATGKMIEAAGWELMGSGNPVYIKDNAEGFLMFGPVGPDPFDFSVVDVHQMSHDGEDERLVAKGVALNDVLTTY